MAKIKRPSRMMKNRFREEKKNNPKLTMKEFARKLAADGDEMAKAWFYNKSMAPIKKAKAERWENKGGTIMLKRAATKLARRRRSLKNQGKDSKGTPEKPVVTSE